MTRKLVTLIAFAASVTSSLFANHAKRQFDVLIRNDTVIDGNGTKGHIADVAVQGSRIVAVEKDSKLSGRMTIDAAGLVLAPGFIDLHNHSEVGISTPAGHLNEGFVRQGVTTIVGGPAGSPSPAQIRELGANSIA